ncbi:MAG: ACT domain-containing protein [Lachnospiraceae bacterium]|nr:ACT domain-containing protein [Lachnospiraceae bacterium]
MNENKQRAIITVVGHDTVGIIARVCTYLAENNINILDISQTIVGGYFNMMMIADLTGKKKHFAEISSELEATGKEIGVMIKIQREDIFDEMHRI